MQVQATSIFLVAIALTIAAVERLYRRQSERVNVIDLDLHVDAPPATLATSALDDLNISDLQKACSTIVTNGSISSGSFVSLTDDDLTKGWFLTAAHSIADVSTVFVTNPIDNQWTKVVHTTTDPRFFFDNVADVAIVRTDIDFSQGDDRNIPLRLAESEASVGDVCVLCGNPLGIDTVSVSIGCVRDPCFVDIAGEIQSEVLFISAPGLQGNSGSPVVNRSGRIVGTFTFVYATGGNTIETLGGGPSLDVLKRTLPVLMTETDNSPTIGVTWYVPSPFEIDGGRSSFPNRGLKILSVSSSSPFASALRADDLVLDVKLKNGDVVALGSEPGQRTLGILLYRDSSEIEGFVVDGRGLVVL